MQLKSLISLFFMLCLAGMPTLLSAAEEPTDKASAKEEPPVEVEADNLEQDEARKVIIATGNVRVSKGRGLEVQAGRAEVNTVTKVVEAWDKVLIFRGQDVFKAEHLVMDTEKNEGYFDVVGMNLAGPGQVGTAEKAERHDENRFTLYEATLTNCECQDPPWYLASSRIRVDLAENMARANNVVLYLRKIPIFYSPYWQQPVKKVRKSGFLIPSLRSSSEGGFEMEIPYYWNIAPDQDMTVTANPIQNRGVMGKVQYRYLDPNYRGILNMHVINDKNRNDDPEEGEIRDEDEWRGLLTWDHDQHLGEWNLATRVNRLRSMYYLDDFQQDLIDDSERVLESRAQIGRLWQNELRTSTSLQGGIIWDQNLQTENDQLTPQQLPFVTVSDSRPFLNLGSNWQLATKGGYVHRYQTEGISSQRMHLNPKVNYSYSNDYGALTSSVGVGETSYYDEGKGARHRESGTFSLRLDTTLEQAFSWDEPHSAAEESGLVMDLDELQNPYRPVKSVPWSDLFAVKHQIQPAVQYTMVGSQRSWDETNTNYGGKYQRITVDNLFNEKFYSGLDRLERGQWLTYSLTNKLLGRAQSRNDLLQLLTFTIGQRWFPSDSEQLEPNDHSFSDVVTEFQFNAPQNWSIGVTNRIDPYLSRVEETRSNLRYIDQRGDIFSFSYYYRPGPDDVQPGREIIREEAEDLVGYTRIVLNDNWAMRLGINYSITTGQTKQWRTGLNYRHDCWQVDLFANQSISLAQRGTSNETWVGILLTLDGLGEWGFDKKFENQLDPDARLDEPLFVPVNEEDQIGTSQRELELREAEERQRLLDMQYNPDAINPATPIK